jgi:NADPH:quinone reductase-like Zn-dependent oxidoreductase
MYWLVVRCSPCMGSDDAFVGEQWFYRWTDAAGTVVASGIGNAVFGGGQKVSVGCTSATCP